MSTLEYKKNALYQNDGTILNWSSPNQWFVFGYKIKDTWLPFKLVHKDNNIKTLIEDMIESNKNISAFGIIPLFPGSDFKVVATVKPETREEKLESTLEDLKQLLEEDSYEEDIIREAKEIIRKGLDESS